MKSKKCLVSIFCLFVIGCGSKSGERTEEPSSTMESIKLYLTQSSYGETRFEQYNIINNIIYYECGTGNNGMNFIKAQNILRVEEVKREDLNEFIDEVFEIDNDDIVNLNKSSSNSSDIVSIVVKQPGKKEVINVSLKVSSEESEVGAEEVHNLIEFVKSVVKDPQCKISAF